MPDQVYTIINNILEQETCDQIINSIDTTKMGYARLAYELKPIEKSEEKYRSTDLNPNEMPDKFRTRNKDIPGTDAGLNSDYYNNIVKLFEPVITAYKDKLGIDISADNCWGIDINLYPQQTYLTPHEDGFEHIILVMLKNRNLVGGDHLLWKKPTLGSTRELFQWYSKICEDFDNDILEPDYVINDISIGSAMYTPDTEFFHAVTKLKQGTRATAILRWGERYMGPNDHNIKLRKELGK